MTVLQSKLVATLSYLVQEWLDMDDLLERPRFANHDRASVDGLLQAVSEVAAKWFEPANRVVDDHEPIFEAGRTIVPDETRAAWQAFVDFGFMLAVHDEEIGGLQLPPQPTSRARWSWLPRPLG